MNKVNLSHQVGASIKPPLQLVKKRKNKVVKGDDFYKVKRADLSINPLTY